MPFREVRTGFLALVPPLFVKGLSVGDVIEAQVDERNGSVFSWSHVTRSRRSTVWLLGLGDSLPAVLEALRAMGCATASMDGISVHSVDVPEDVSLDALDGVLEQLDAEAVVVAFPSLRHGNDAAGPEGPLRSTARRRRASSDELPCTTTARLSRGQVATERNWHRLTQIENA
jgi:hypothetical protein